MSRGSANMRDVAADAGVSVTTVSRFLGGSLRLPEATRLRIETSIKNLQYVPNPHARRLSSGRSETIGLVIPDIANPFFATLAAAIEEEAHKRQLTLELYATLNNESREFAYLQLLRSNHIDGLIFATNHSNTQMLAHEINTLKNVIIVDEDVEQANVPKLFCDNDQGGYLAGCHLATNGHHNVLFLASDMSMLSAKQRFIGFERAMRNYFGNRANIQIYEGEYTIEFGQKAAMRFIEEQNLATAIFSTSDEMTKGLLEVFHEKNIKIPQDVSLIGFDDICPLHLFSPAITAIRQPAREIGQKSVALLLNLTKHEIDKDDGNQHTLSPLQHRTHLLPVDLHIRNSIAKIN